MITNIVFIPLRAGSKRIKNKNTIDFLGKPLFMHILESAYYSFVDKIYVSTDDIKVVSYLQDYKGFIKNKIVILNRKKDLCQDDTSTDKVLIDFAEDYNFMNLILLQATSPYTTTKDINEAITLFTDSQADTLLSVVPQSRFIWREIFPYNCYGYSSNYDCRDRPRTQDILRPLLVENGAIYITPRKGLLKTKCRLYGKTILFRMPEDCYLELDNYYDLYALEAIMRDKNEKTNR